MATITTTQTSDESTFNMEEVLRGYRVHHSALSGDGEAQSHRQPFTGQQPSRQPPGWDTAHRRVPPHRPVNRTRDLSEVRVYLSGVERAFVTVMFTGLFVNATAAKVWHRTFGRLNDAIFRYPVGGEI